LGLKAVALVFKRKGEAVEHTALPADVMAALDGATFHSRHSNEGSRVIVQPAGMRGWVHSAEADAKALSSFFPELTEAQLARACRYIANLVRGHLRRLDDGGEQRKSWVNNW